MGKKIKIRIKQKKFQKKNKNILSNRLYIQKNMVGDAERCEFTYTVSIGEEKYRIATYSEDAKYVGFCRGDLGKIYKVFPDLIDKVVDKRSKINMTYPLKFVRDLWPNQKKATKKWLSFKYGQLKSPARSGKTVMGVYIACKLGLKTLILAHQKELLDQFDKTINNFTNANHLRKINGTKFITGRIKDWNDVDKFDIATSTYQRLFTSRGQKILENVKNNFGLVIVDECHTGAAHQYRSVIDKFNPYYRLGLTATPDRKDELHILANDVLGPVTSSGIAKSLTCKVYFIKTNYDIPKFSRWTTFVNRLCGNNKRNKLIIKYAVKDAKKGRNILIVSDRVAHTKLLTKMLTDKGIKAKYLIGASLNRDELLDEARSGEIQVVVAIRKLVKFGLDIPRWSVYYNIVPIAYTENYYQEMSRIRTPMKGKPIPIIRYFLDNGHGAIYACKSIAQKVHKREGFSIKNEEDEENRKKTNW